VPTAELLEETWQGNERASGLAMLLDRAGMLAVDTDSPKATSWAIEQFRRYRTPWFQSARGRKWLFRLPGCEVRSSASKLHESVDIRAPNSALVIPPTPGLPVGADLLARRRPRVSVPGRAPEGPGAGRTASRAKENRTGRDAVAVRGGRARAGSREGLLGGERTPEHDAERDGIQRLALRAVR
jgi:hypothetical protein